MTDETSRPTSEDTPAPPASTRWTEEPLHEDDAVASPFVPGRSAPRTPTQPAPTSSEAQRYYQDVAPWDEGRKDTPEAEDAPAVEDAPAEARASEPVAADTTEESAPDSFPFDQFDLEGEDEAGDSGAAPDAEPGPAPEMGWTPGDLNVEETAEQPAIEEPTVEEPTAEGPTAEESTAEEPAIEEPTAEEPVVAGPTAREASGTEPAREAAEILERLAGLLRSEGVEAVQGEMQSADRLTSLLAGLVAGYVTGRGPASG